jgi:hypothetical protein
MYPIAYSKQNFDVNVKWRDTYDGSPIDTTGVFPDGSRFDGIAGLKRELMRHPEQFVSTIAERLLMYALGRNLQYYDAPSVRAVVREAAASHYTFASLVAGVVKTKPFTMREVPVTATK